MTPNTNQLEQWVREETLVRIVYTDGEDLVSKGYVRASPLDCILTHASAKGVHVREGGVEWMFRFAQVPDPLSRPACPVVSSITPLEG